MNDELEYLLVAISCSVTGEQSEALSQHLRDPGALRRLLRLAIKTKTFGIVTKTIAIHTSIEGQEFLNQASVAFVGATMKRSHGILRKTMSVVRLLQGSGLDFVIVKGPIQQYQIYGQYFVRPCSDIDILVRGSDYRRAIRILCDGLRLSVINQSPFLWWDVFVGERHLIRREQDEWSIDLHHRVQAPGSAQPRRTSDFVTHAVRHKLAGLEVPALAPAYVPLMSALSIVKALRRRELAAAHLADLFAVTLHMSAAEKAGLLGLAESQGLAGTLKLALDIATAAFDRGPPAIGFGRQFAEGLFVPETFKAWPPVSYVLRTSTEGPNSSRLREGIWYELSEISRKLEKIANLAKVQLRGRQG